MSLTRIVTVHCDECGQWEHTSDSQGDSRRYAASRKRAGWLTIGHGSDRRDYCPKCALNHAADAPEDREAVARCLTPYRAGSGDSRYSAACTLDPGHEGPHGPRSADAPEDTR